MVGFGLAGGLAHGGPALLWVALAFLAFGGAVDMVSAAFRSTMLQQVATDEMRGRLQGVFIVVVAGGPRMGDMLHGTAAAPSAPPPPLPAAGCWWWSGGGRDAGVPRVPAVPRRAAVADAERSDADKRPNM